MRQYVRELGDGGSNFTRFRTEGSQTFNHGDELLIESKSKELSLLNANGFQALALSEHFMDGAVIKTSIPEEPEEAATTILRGGHFHIG
ncbi:hypothetical protein NC651_011774 [Populus alba x Populus x berolinensis]|nr:hypothetical protein NC651_011774 [Populus alba x Populus x berolinensis]